jgi:hypothetical protein
MSVFLYPIAVPGGFPIAMVPAFGTTYTNPRLNLVAVKDYTKITFGISNASGLSYSPNIILTTLLGFVSSTVLNVSPTSYLAIYSYPIYVPAGYYCYLSTNTYGYTLDISATLS